MTIQLLGEMLASATNMHDLVKGMRLEWSFRPPNADPSLPASERRRLQMARTAAVIGAGAGAGVAIGSMARSERGMWIGALVGAAGGLVIDQVLRHRAERGQAATGRLFAPPHEPGRGDIADRILVPDRSDGCD